MRDLVLAPVHLVVPAAAHAAPPVPAVPAAEMKAREAFAAGRYDEALQAFAKLYAETLHPVYLRNIGRCHQKMREPQKAIDAFQDYLAKTRAGKDKITADERAEIEGYINEMPGVAESAVVGVPHPDFGEVGVAVVTAKGGTALDGERIIAALKSQLANFKIPKRCFVVDELPRNTMGKVQKNLLRDQHKALFS